MHKIALHNLMHKKQSFKVKKCFKKLKKKNKLNKNKKNRFKLNNNKYQINKIKQYLRNWRLKINKIHKICSRRKNKNYQSKKLLKKTWQKKDLKNKKSKLS